MKKLFLVIIAVMILQFNVTGGQMDPKLHGAEYSDPAYFTPNTSSGMQKSPYTSSRNVPSHGYIRNDPLRGDRYPTYYGSERNNPPLFDTNKNYPADLSPVNNRNSPYFDSNQNHQGDISPVNNRNAPNFDSNQNYQGGISPVNNRNPPYSDSNQNYQGGISPVNNRNAPNFDSNQNYQGDISPVNNRNPSNFDSNQNYQGGISPVNNRNAPNFDSNQNYQGGISPVNNRNPPYSDSNQNYQGGISPVNNRNAPNFDSNQNYQGDISPVNNRNPSNFDSNQNYHEGLSTMNKRNSPYLDSNQKFHRDLSTVNNRNSNLSSRRTNHRRPQGKFPNVYSSEKDSQRGQSIRNTHSSRYNPAYFSSNNNDPSDHNPPERQEESELGPPPVYYLSDPLKGGRIVCLFPASKFFKTGFHASMIPAFLCNIVNYEFATLNPRTYELNPGNSNLDYGEKFYNVTVDLKKLNPHLKVMLSLGGWADSTRKYSDLVASPKKVRNFIQKAVVFLKNHGFDGLDVAWEYPNCWQGAAGVSKKDKPNFARFLQKLRKAFDTENFLLSISVSSIKREIRIAYDGQAITKAVHFINVMTYDMHGPWENKTGHHSQFDKRPKDSDPSLNSKAAMDYWVGMGVSKSQLNMGIPTYGTSFTLKDSTRHGLGAPVKGPGRPGALSRNGGTLCFREICQYLDAGNWTEEEDKDAGVYAYSGDQWVGYDSLSTVVKKVKWIAQKGYGGVLFKDVSCDDFEGKCKMTPFPMIRIAGMEFTEIKNKRQDNF